MSKQLINLAPTDEVALKSDIPDASTSTKGLVKLSNATNSTSQTTAATSSAVKSAYDRASTAINAANNAATEAQNRLDKRVSHDNEVYSRNRFYCPPVSDPLSTYGSGDGNGSNVSSIYMGNPVGGHAPVAVALWDALGPGRWGGVGSVAEPDGGSLFLHTAMSSGSYQYQYVDFDPFDTAILGELVNGSYYDDADKGGATNMFLCFDNSSNGSYVSMDLFQAVRNNQDALGDSSPFCIYVNGVLWRRVLPCTLNSYDDSLLPGPTSLYLTTSSNGSPCYYFSCALIDYNEYVSNYNIVECGSAGFNIYFRTFPDGHVELTMEPYYGGSYWDPYTSESVSPDSDPFSNSVFTYRASTSPRSPFGDDGYTPGQPTRYACLAVDRVTLSALHGWSPVRAAVFGTPPKTPISPSSSASSGEYADAKATGQALDGKAASSAIRYDLKSATASGTTSQTVTVSDRAITSVSLNSACTSLAITPPSAVSGKARDFLMRVTVQGSAGPSTVTFGSGQTIDIGATDLTEMETGVNVLAFTEISANHWMVARRGA